MGSCSGGTSNYFLDMKNFSLRNISLFFAGITAIIFLHYLRVLSPAESLAQRALNPFFSVFYSAGGKLRAIYDRQAAERDLLAENSDLKKQLAEQTIEIAKFKTIEDENKLLREQLNFFKAGERKYLMVNVSSLVSAGGANQSFVVDRGSADGLFAGLPVVAGNGMVVGKIVETKEHLSEACLISSSRCQFAAAIANQNRTIGLAKGDLGLTVKMDFIPQTEEIKAGDLVVTSGLEKNVPRGLVLGKVTAVNRSNKELWQTAVLEPFIDLNDLIFAAVLVP